MRRKVVATAVLMVAWLMAGSVSPAQAQETTPAVCSPLGKLIANAQEIPANDDAYAAQVADGEALMAEVRPLADGELKGLLDGLDAFSAAASLAITEAGGVANLTAEQRSDLQGRGNGAVGPLASYQ